MAIQTQLAFFSYSRKDSEFALRLAKDLRASGVKIWLDQLDISAGQLWDRAVEAALENSPRLLVILSPFSVESTNVMNEVNAALEDGKTVIPLLYRECRIPFRLRRVQYVDFRMDYDSGFSGLLKTFEADQPDVPEPAKERSASVDAHPESVDTLGFDVSQRPPQPTLANRAAASAPATPPVFPTPSPRVSEKFRREETRRNPKPPAPPEPPPKPRFCIYCSSPLIATNKFCIGCGRAAH